MKWLVVAGLVVVVYLIVRQKASGATVTPGATVPTATTAPPPPQPGAGPRPSIDVVPTSPVLEGPVPQTTGPAGCPPGGCTLGTSSPTGKELPGGDQTNSDFNDWESTPGVGDPNNYPPSCPGFGPNWDPINSSCDVYGF